MEYEVFISEWFRTTWITRKNSIHEQLGELNETGCRLELTVVERASLGYAFEQRIDRILWANREDW